jgi:hypothetical protein
MLRVRYAYVYHTQDQNMARCQQVGGVLSTKILAASARTHRIAGAMPPAKRFEVHVNLGLTRAMAERLDRVLDREKGETRLAAIREALIALIKQREASRRK